MQNKVLERLSTLQLLAPVGVNIVSGNVYTLGRQLSSEGVTVNHLIVGVAATSTNTTDPAYDPNNNYFTLDCEGAFNLSVTAETQGSPSAGAAINIGDPVFADGGTYDKVSGITYGQKLSADATGTFIGIALTAIAAGVTATIPVMLKGAA